MHLLHYLYFFEAYHGFRLKCIHIHVAGLKNYTADELSWNNLSSYFTKVQEARPAQFPASQTQNTAQYKTVSSTHPSPPPPWPTISPNILPPSQKTQLILAPFPGSAQPSITYSMVNPLMQAMESWTGPGSKASSPGSVGNMLMSLDSSACMNRTTLVLPHVIQIPNPLCNVLNPDRTTVRGRT